MDKSKNGVELLEYQSVPTGDTEDKFASTPKKYTVNKSPTGVRISRPVLFLIMAGVVLLLVGAVLATFFLVPRCTESVTAPVVQPEVLAEIKTPIQDWDERLPKTLRPTHYRIQIIPFITPGNFTTHGEVSITFKCDEDTEKISFHINDIVIHEKFLKVTQMKDGKVIDIPVQEFQYEPEKQRLTITVEDFLTAGGQYEIYIKFTGHLNDLLQGFYRINYYDYVSREERWMAATQFSPTDARRAFPCFDEPAMKAKFTISLARTTNMTTRSNMELKETAPIEGMNGWVWDHYPTTPTMSTYLIAMVVSDLQFVDYNSTESQVKFKVWSRNEALQQTKYAGLIGPRILTYFETYFKIKFPLPKIDIMALPDFGFTAMENWGLITFREAGLLYDTNNTPVKEKRQIVTVLSHELGHQWFGNLVTPNWWDDLWLKEGFATYVEYLGAHQVQPTWNILDEMVISELQTSFEVDCLMSSHPIYAQVNHTNQIREIFDPISYAKGASVIRMINNFLGEYTFKVGLINYLNEKKYANAHHDDLWYYLTTQAHIDGTLEKEMTVKQIMDTWILQSGYPVVTVTRNYENNSADLSQQRFFLGENNNDDTKWWIPISYTTSLENNVGSSVPKVWMKNEEEITLEDLHEEYGWLYVNINEAGYYRVNYDITNWKLLVRNLRNFPAVVRAQLIDDALNLARANLLPYDVPFNLMVEVFKNPEQGFVPLEATFKGLEFLNDMLSSTSSYGKLKQFLSLIIEKVLKNVGLDEKPDDNYEMQRRRASVLEWACRLESTDCIMHARHLFRNWMLEEGKDGNPISPNLKSVVYCTAIREGGESEWNFAFSQFQKSNLATEKTVLLQALGCASEPWVLSKYLNLISRNDSYNSPIRKQDGSAVFKSVASNVAGYQLAFNFLRNHWKELNEYYGPAFSAISKMVSSLSTHMNTPYQLEALEAFKEQNTHDLGTSERAIYQTIEKVRANVEWMEHSYKEVENWLENTLNHFRVYK